MLNQVKMYQTWQGAKLGAVTGKGSVKQNYIVLICMVCHSSTAGVQLHGCITVG